MPASRNGNPRLNRLRRITRDGSWIPEIDGLRFVAIMSVVFLHVFMMINSPGHPLAPDAHYWWMGRLFLNGDRGVRLFFVISGIILSMPFARFHLLGAKPVSLRKYYMRRVTRLEPPYILSLIVGSIAYLIFWHRFMPNFAGHFFASLFYQHNLIFGEHNALSSVAWSLEVEIQFYLLAPLIMQCYRIRPTGVRRAILLGAIMLLGAMQAPFYENVRFHLSILFYIQYFLMGLVVADILILDLDKMKPSWLWDIAGIAALGAMYWPDHDSYWPHAILPVFIAVLCLSAMRSRLLRPAFFANPWIAVTGGMCYSIYLIHLDVASAIHKVTKHLLLPHAAYPVNLALLLILTIVPTLLVCTVFFVLIERPCMDPNWPSKLAAVLTRRRTTELALLDATGVAE